MFSTKKKNFKLLDKRLLIYVLILVFYGLFVLNSAVHSLQGHHMRNQLTATFLGLSTILIILILDMDFIKKMYLPIYLICVVLLIAVRIIGVGDNWGARSWIALGPIQFQPSEFVKVGLILSLARFIEIHHEKINDPLTLVKILIFAMIPVYLILREPDFGTAVVFMFFIGAMLFVAGLDFRYIFGALAAAIVSFPLLYLRLSEIQKDRILNFLNPERDTSNTGLQAWRGRIAIGSGRLRGQGYLQGTQSQFNFIPEKQTDFIFPVLVEELGFIGGMLLLILYGLMLYECVKIARKTESLYGKLIITGFSAMFLFHIFENIGMTIGVMPITGIPLPFMSYGGTFQIINLICIGLVLSVSIQKEPLSFK